MNLLDAAFNVVHDYKGGSASLAPRMGKGVSSLSHELTGTGTAKLGLLDAEKITHLTGDMRILLAFAANAGMMLVALPVEDESTPKDVMFRLADMAKEFGEACAAVASSVASSSVSPNELLKIDRECSELIASVLAMRTAVAKLNGGAQ